MIRTRIRILLKYFQFDYNISFELRSLTNILKKNGFLLEYGDETIKSIFSLQLNKEENVINHPNKILYNHGKVLMKIKIIEYNYLERELWIRSFRCLTSFFYQVKNRVIATIIDSLIFAGYKKNVSGENIS